MEIWDESDVLRREIFRPHHDIDVAGEVESKLRAEIDVARAKTERLRGEVRRLEGELTNKSLRPIVPEVLKALKPYLQSPKRVIIEGVESLLSWPLLTPVLNFLRPKYRNPFPIFSSIIFLATTLYINELEISISLRHRCERRGEEKTEAFESKPPSLSDTEISNIIALMGTTVDPSKDAVESFPGDKKISVVFVLGGPGSGKGTQCAKIVENFGFTHLSAGDLLRAEIKSGSENGTMISNMIKEGKIVPSEVTIKLLQKAMIENGNDKFLIDGFPRNEENRAAFESVTKIEPEFILFFECPEEEMERRLLSRNQGRDDDNIETIRKRFKVFMESSMPVVEYYDQKGKVHKVDAMKPVDEVFETVKAIFSPFNSKNQSEYHHGPVLYLPFIVLCFNCLLLSSSPFTCNLSMLLNKIPGIARYSKVTGSTDQPVEACIP
ncbi:UMP-CMP kinase 4-like [Canna indica]|uniref:UMP-CMP kinase n=1 Tax=Canna indica TaxID=4628 RepID=A0AAQ3K2N2_9LILI|nr:UMP-CMP kinase 4-like [Canna indica]